MYIHLFLFFYSFIHTIFFYLYSLIFPSFHLKTHRQIILYIVTLFFILSFIFSYLFICNFCRFEPPYMQCSIFPSANTLSNYFYSLNFFFLNISFSTGLGLHPPVCKYIAHFLILFNFIFLLILFIIIIFFNWFIFKLLFKMYLFIYFNMIYIHFYFFSAGLGLNICRAPSSHLQTHHPFGTNVLYTSF